MVEIPTWKELLLNLVAKEEIDPWNIDIEPLSEAFITEVKNMNHIDFHMPANLILASSILLKFKSEGLKFEAEQEIEEFYDDTPFESAELELTSRVPPSRPVTLNELVGAMEQAFKQEEFRAVKMASKRAEQKEIKPRKVMEVGKYDIEKEQLRTQEIIASNHDDQKLIMFSYLQQIKKDESPVYTLLPLLYIYQKGIIDMQQDVMFNDIIIRWVGQTQQIMATNKR